MSLHRALRPALASLYSSATLPSRGVPHARVMPTVPRSCSSARILRSDYLAFLWLCFVTSHPEAYRVWSGERHMRVRYSALFSVAGSGARNRDLVVRRRWQQATRCFTAPRVSPTRVTACSARSQPRCRLERRLSSQLRLRRRMDLPVRSRCRVRL